MKILMISHSPLVSGGAEKCLMEYAEVLNNQGHECNVIIPAKGELSRALTAKKIRWTVASYIWATKPVRKSAVHHSIVGAGNSLASIFREVEKFKPDMIMTNTVVVPWGLYIGKALNIPTVLLVHETLSDKRHILNMEPSYEAYADILDKNADYVIYNSLFTKNDYSDVIKTPIISKDILYPVPNVGASIDSLYIENALNDVIKIAVIGSIQERKNQLEVLQAAKVLIDRKITKFQLNLYGDHDPKYLKHVQLFIKENGLEDCVDIKGYTNNVYRVINEHNVIVSSFLFESFGRVALEGQLFGRVVIANTTGASPELIKDMHNGLIYESGDVNQLADKIEWVLNNKQEALKMGKTARSEQRRKYLSDRRYDALTKVVEYYSKPENKPAGQQNRFDPVSSLSAYSVGLEHKYRHIHKLTHNRVTRGVLHRGRVVLKTVYYRFK